MFTLFFVILGSSAALFGRWVEREGPRKAGVVAACCWGGGFFISALGIYLHQIWLLWLGSGVIGGCGLGLGYISPVSTLIKWFPDRRGMATGLAIMGFGGGAMIGTPLADVLMKHFATPDSVGVWQTFVVLRRDLLRRDDGRRVRLPPAAARLDARRLDAAGRRSTRRGRRRRCRCDVAWTTPQFWLLWGVLCLNVTAGIGVLGIASPMIQEIFKGRVTRVGGGRIHRACSACSTSADASSGRRCPIASAARPTYTVFFALGMLLYASAPTAGASGSLALFVAIFCVILTMYGGGFATIPAYLADSFGVGNVSAIHGRLLTAWSTAGILGPVARQLHPRVPDRPRRRAGGRLHVHDVRPRRVSRRRLDLQSRRASGRRASVHRSRWRRGAGRAPQPKAAATCRPPASGASSPSAGCSPACRSLGRLQDADAGQPDVPMMRALTRSNRGRTRVRSRARRCCARCAVAASLSLRPTKSRKLRGDATA